MKVEVHFIRSRYISNDLHTQSTVSGMGALLARAFWKSKNWRLEAYLPRRVLVMRRSSL